jgi:hypothetical protein
MGRLCRIGVLVAALFACGRQASAPSGDLGVPQTSGVDPYKELVIVDSSVVLDARGSNASDGAWSFRRMVERLTPPGTTAPAVAESWLRSFRVTQVGGRAVDDRPGAERLLAAWPRANDGSLDLAKAPFRLIAIASRLDLVTSPNGEGRLIYGLVDQASGEPGLMSVAFEYALPAAGAKNDRQAWAERWHALAAHAFGDQGFVAGFSTLVPSDEKVHAFTWDGTTMTELGAAPGLPWSAVTGRNAAGTMVGNIYDVPAPDANVFEIHAFVYARNAILDLNSFARSPLPLRTALGIDDGGRVLCTDGQVGARHAHGILLTPK